MQQTDVHDYLVILVFNRDFQLLAVIADDMRITWTVTFSVAAATFNEKCLCKLVLKVDTLPIPTSSQMYNKNFLYTRKKTGHYFVLMIFYLKRALGSSCWKLCHSNDYQR